MSGRYLDGDHELDAALSGAGKPVLPPGLVARIVAEVPQLPQKSAPSVDGAAPAPVSRRAIDRPRFRLAAAVAGIAALTGLSLAMWDRLDPVPANVPSTREILSAPSVIASAEPAASLPSEHVAAQATDQAAPVSKSVLAEADPPKRIAVPPHASQERKPSTVIQPRALASGGDPVDTPEEQQDLVNGPIDETRSKQLIGPVLPQRGLGYAGSPMSSPQAGGPGDAMGGPAPAGVPSRMPGN